MNTIHIELDGGASIALPAEKAASALIAHLQGTTRQFVARPKIGDYLANQGGVFVGSIRGDDGVEYGLILAEEKDIGRFTWGPDGERDLSGWDGLGNTNRLNDADNPAAFNAAKYEKDGHLDFYLPSRREMMIALANVPYLFDKDSWYWTSTPAGDWGAWAVGFESGTVTISLRDTEFLVRPVRRFPL